MQSCCRDRESWIHLWRVKILHFFFWFLIFLFKAKTLTNKRTAANTPSTGRLSTLAPSSGTAPRVRYLWWSIILQIAPKPLSRARAAPLLVEKDTSKFSVQLPLGPASPMSYSLGPTQHVSAVPTSTASQPLRPTVAVLALEDTPLTVPSQMFLARRAPRLEQ